MPDKSLPTGFPVGTALLADFTTDAEAFVPAALFRAIDTEPLTPPGLTGDAGFILPSLTLPLTEDAGLVGLATVLAGLTPAALEVAADAPLAVACAGLTVAEGWVILCLDVTEAFPEGFPV